MKFRQLFFLLTFHHLNCVITALSIHNEVVNNATSTASQDDYLEGISIQDILSSDIDASEKIENRIINMVTKLSSDCNTYKDVDLSVHDLPLPEDNISINLGTENVIFHDFNLTTTGEPNNSNEKLYSYSTSIRCQSSKIGEVVVKLPKIIKITAALKVIQISGFLKEIVIPGSISLILRNGSIVKQFSIEGTSKFTNYVNDISSRIIYSNSEVQLNIDARFQAAIYNKLGAFFKEVESSIGKIFAKKLNEKFLQNGISLTDICSKFETSDESSEVNSSISNNILNDLYVIPNAKLETWKGVDLSAGPIIIKGLSSFNSTELVVINNQYSNPNNTGYPTNRPTTLKHGELELKEITVRIRTNELKGRFDWSYNHKKKSFLFFVEYLEFEIRKNSRFLYELEQFYHEKEFEVGLRLEDIRFKSLKSNGNENESEFAQFVLNEYLKSAIADSIKTSLFERQKRQVPPLFSQCEFLK